MKKGDYRKCPIGKNPAECKIAWYCAACDYYVYNGKPPYMKKRE